MLNSISQHFFKAANGKSLLLFLLLLIAFEVLLINISGKIETASNGASVLDLSMAYSPSDAYDLYLDKYSEEGRALYIKAECIDLLFPIVYTFFLALLISMGIKRFPEMPQEYRLLNILPLGALLADYLENAGIFTLLLTYPEKSYNAALWASGFGSLKWMIVFCVYLACARKFGIDNHSQERNSFIEQKKKRNLQHIHSFSFKKCKQIIPFVGFRQAKKMFILPFAI